MKKRLLAVAAGAALTLTALPYQPVQADETQTIAAIASANPDFSTLVAAASAAGLVGAIDECTDAPVTVFAPTNAAFATALASLGLTAEQLLGNKDLLTSVLTYHIVAGKVPASTVVGLNSAITLNGKAISIAVVNGGVVLNGSVKVTTTDIMACNGIIHVIDAVLIPPTGTGLGTQTIAAIASGNPDFSTLVAAAGAAGLVGAIDECTDGPVTVFAPTNAAFATALSALGLTPEQLLGNKDLLTSVLTYHIVAGNVPASEVVKLTSATTLNGKPISIAVVNGGVVLNGTAKVVVTDIYACNGIIHVIDAVLLPPADAPATTIPTNGGTLPETGSSNTPIALTAAALMLLGLGTVAATRRRRVA